MRAEDHGSGRIERGRRRVGVVTGTLLVLVGLLLLGGVSAYYVYGIYARSQLHKLDATIEGPVTLPPESARAGFVPVTPAGAPQNPSIPATLSAPDDPPGQIGAASNAPLPDSPSSAQSAPVSAEDFGFPQSIFATIYPGYQIHPKYWSQPLWAGSDPFPHEETSLPSGFRAASDSDLVAAQAVSARAQSIRIPIIDVESSVEELAILDLGDSRAYETPKNVVGHIPETSYPGEAGNGWFFGHLESPIRGEGDVFRRLPRIPVYLNEGDPVYISVESDTGEYLYQVTETRVVHADDLELYDSEDATITLVACVPRLVYSHRLLVTAKLVGVKG